MTRRNRPSAGSPEARQDSVAATPAFAPNDWFFAAALVAAVFLAYQPAWQGGLLVDDHLHLGAPELHSWHGLYRIWFDLGATQQYYPLLETAFWVEHNFWGPATLGYHLVNILLHALAALMVALVLRRLKIPGAYLAAAIFALHPVHVESVAWISEQKNTLSAVFYMAAAIAYLRFDDRRGRAWYLVALGLFALSLVSKIVTVTLPAALLVIFWWQRGRLSWRRDVLPLAPFFAVALVAGLVVARLEGKLVGAEVSGFTLTVLQRCLLAGRVIWFYLYKLLWPADLLFVYPRWQISPTVWWQYLYSVTLLVLLAVLWRLRRRWRAPLAGMLFFVGTLFPVLGFLNVYWFLLSYVADHHQYLASLGIIAPVAAGAALLLERRGLWRRPVGNALCLALVAVLASLTWQQSQRYDDAETLYRTTIENNADCWLAHYNLGLLLADRGEIDEAIDHYQIALTVRPDFGEARNNLGLALAGRGRFDEAIAQYRKALEVRPDHVQVHDNLGLALAARGQTGEAMAEYRRALDLAPGDAEAHINLGMALENLGRADEALAEYRKALELKPDSAEAHNNLGALLAGRGLLDEAIAQYEEAIAINPDFAAAHNNLGLAVAGRGQGDEAISHYRQALDIDPTLIDARNNLANALAGRGRPDEAIREYEKALDISPNQAEIHNNLGLVLVRGGRLDEAIDHFRKAVEIKPDFADARKNLAIALGQKSRAD